MDADEQKRFDWIKNVYGDWEEHAFMIKQVELVQAEIKRLKAENEDFKTALDETLQRKQDALIQRDKLREANEKLQVQLAGCSVAALGGTNDTAKQGDYGWSASYQDALELRLKYEQLREALESIKVDAEIRTDFSIDTLRKVIIRYADEALKYSPSEPEP